MGWNYLAERARDAALNSCGRVINTRDVAKGREETSPNRSEQAMSVSE